MTGASLVGELVVVAAQLLFREAVTDFGYVAAVLVTTAVFLTRAGERQHAGGDAREAGRDRPVDWSLHSSSA